MGKIDLDKFNIRTDLAFEAIDLHNFKNNENVQEEEYSSGKVKVRRTVIGEAISEKLGKRAGLYYTLDTTSILTHDHDDLLETENALTEVILDVMKFEGINPQSKGLVVGLGNYNVTPDSLGPIVIDNVMVTRHMYLLNPEEVSEGVSEISAIAPGVMGTTGIETYDIIEAVLNKIEVNYIIAVDALASRSIARVNKTIQVTNTGISPGSGVGNQRKELSKQSLNIPVIAIGVPTVVDAATITSDTIDFILKHLNKKISEQPRPSSRISFGGEVLDFEHLPLPNEEKTKYFLGEFGVLSENEKRDLIVEVLTPNGYNMMVTPKEIDMDIEDLSKVISRSIDRAVHPIVNQS